MKSYVIHLLRHGLVEGNFTGQYIGVTDQPLCPQGMAQLVERKKAGGYPQAERYYVSPLLRCRQTMKLFYPDAQPQVIDDLRECSFGEWEGRTAAQLKLDGRFTAWMQNGGVEAPPGGESGVEMQARACEAFSELVYDMMRTGVHSAVVVTHAGIIMSILAAFGLPRADFFDWMTSPGCGYSVRVTPNLWMTGKVFEVFAMLPEGERQDEEQERAIRLAREAARRAYSRSDSEEDSAP